MQSDTATLATELVALAIFALMVAAGSHVLIAL
jgi:hypothetical protein